jgi:hypothetical protein
MLSVLALSFVRRALSIARCRLAVGRFRIASLSHGDVILLAVLWLRALGSSNPAKPISSVDALSFMRRALSTARWSEPESRFTIDGASHGDFI